MTVGKPFQRLQFTGALGQLLTLVPQQCDLGALTLSL